MDSKPTIPEVLPLVRKYYEKDENSMGGSLHIVLEDGNVDDRDVQFCLERAIAIGDKEGEELARILLRMSKSQRFRLYRTNCDAAITIVKGQSTEKGE